MHDIPQFTTEGLQTVSLCHSHLGEDGWSFEGISTRLLYTKSKETQNLGDPKVVLKDPERLNIPNN